MARQASPALSEDEVDISRSLFRETGAEREDETDSEVDSEHGRPRDSSGLKDANVLDTDEEDEAFIAATQSAANRKSELKIAKKSGAFQTMGLNAHVLKAITRKGFSVPTPIQRRCVPLILDGQDVVGMARTGSGKTAAFVIPMIEKLKSHSAKVGARALVLSPSRELALQTLKVVKELARGTDLRTCLLVGGDSLEDQFAAVTGNPDIIVATPGRFEHLKVEMNLELSSVMYVVFDEADRLFEMGFAAQLAEIMHSLPSNRQTLLFSATLPKSLVEFARAGLQDPKLVRLDVEGKISPGLESAFFSVKRAEKEGALLHLLQDIIQMPTGDLGAAITSNSEHGRDSKKRKRGAAEPSTHETPSPHSTVVFAATKHHVEYLAALLKSFGYATSYVYGSLDQTARRFQTQDFRSGKTNILVVTDVAARGLDIPILANVINYDFPSQPKIYVHRVGRTARAGKLGWSYSLVTEKDMPYLVDLQLFLGRKLMIGKQPGDSKRQSMFKDCIVLGTFIRDSLERNVEEALKIVEDDVDLLSMKEVSAKGEKQYLRTRNSASTESVKRAKQILKSDEAKASNMLFDNDKRVDTEQARLDMLARVSGFRPQENVFEIGRRGEKSAAGEVMRQRRAKVQPKHQQQKGDDSDDNFDEEPVKSFPDGADMNSDDDDEQLELSRPYGADMEDASEDELQLTFSQPESNTRRKKQPSTGQGSEFFMGYTPATMNLAEDRGYGVHSGGNSNFVNDARDAAMDLTQDESKAFSEANKPRGVRWDKKSKKYVQRANDEDGSKGKRFITGESGQKIAASFRSGRFDAWRKAHRIERLPRVGDQERLNHSLASSLSHDRRFKHKQEKAPKQADKYRDDFYKKKKKLAQAGEQGKAGFVGANPKGRGKANGELRSVDEVRKARKLKARRREKNARPSRRT